MSEPRQPTDTGGRKDRGLRYSLIPALPLAEVAKLYTRGAAKYAAHNWRHGYTYSQSFDALNRHAQAWLAGEDVDPENGCHHMAAVVFHAFAIMEFEMLGKGADDRFPQECEARCFREAVEGERVPDQLDTPLGPASPTLTKWKEHVDA